MAQSIFQRIEKKFLLDEAQYQAFREEISGFTKPDAFPTCNIYNLYFDTPDFRIIRKSLEKPAYKEKLRLRTYGVATAETPSFIELKKKYRGVVYKRRMELPYGASMSYLSGEEPPQPTQISREVDYFLAMYPRLAPAMMIAYDRIALCGTEDSGLRITFDTNIRYRRNRLDLALDGDDRQIIQPDQHLMEIKVAGAYDLRLAHILDKLEIRQTSFSKYGRGYQMELEEGLVGSFTQEMERGRQNYGSNRVFTYRPRAAFYAIA